MIGHFYNNCFFSPPSWDSCRITSTLDKTATFYSTDAYRLAYHRALPPSMRALQQTPVTSTETIDTPVPLYPTCLDACGNMVALGTREGPVLLFDTTSSGGGGGSSGRCRGGTPPALETTAAAERSAMTPRAAAAARVPGKVATPTTALDGSSNRSESTASVTRVYGSLADGTGPTTAVLLDRAKVIAAGRGSRRSGGGFVIRCGVLFVFGVPAEKEARTTTFQDVLLFLRRALGASFGLLRTGAVVRCGVSSARAVFFGWSQ